MFPLDRLEDIKNHPNDFKLLERVPITRPDVLELIPIRLTEALPNENVCPIVFLDTETTGMSPINDKIIELGMVRCTFSLDRRILLSIDRIYDEYEDPKRPIPPEITALTGITDEMVKGKRIDDDMVISFFAGNPLIVAHNAKFDRPFVDRRFQAVSDAAWGCSAYEIQWSSLGFNGYKLEFLIQSSGYFYEAHRADIDCLALTFLMHIKPEAFNQLIESSLRMAYRIDAVRCPFEKKDMVKQHGYRWDADKKVWYIQVVGEDSLSAEVSFLKTVYPEAPNVVEVVGYSATERYRER